MAPFLLLSLALPLVLALPLGRYWQRWTDGLVPLVALPALGPLAFPHLALPPSWPFGPRLGLDDTNPPFLLLAGLLGTAVGWYARDELAGDPGKVRFRRYWLLALAGGLGTILALDVATFGGFFLLAVLAAYGLIAYEGSPAARGAGRLYLVMALFGGVMLLEALVTVTARSGSGSWLELAAGWAGLPERNWVIGLYLAGFGIVMAVAPLHVWLPAANAHLPAAAGALLNGLLLVLGLLGWLRFLPLGGEAVGGWGAVCMVVGLLAVFYGAAWGLLQTRPGIVLAYAGIGQMGMLAILIGIGLQAPAHWPAVLTAVQGCALSFGLTVAALFLGADMAARGGRRAGWILLAPALALAGAPLTGGSLSGLLIAEAFRLAPGDWPNVLAGLRWLATTMTALLTIRFVYVSWNGNRAASPASAGCWLAWLALVGSMLVVPWLWALQQVPEAVPQLLNREWIRAGVATLLIAAVLAAAFWGSWRAEGYGLPLPLADVLSLFARGLGAWSRRLFRPGPEPRPRPPAVRRGGERLKEDPARR